MTEPSIGVKERGPGKGPATKLAMGALVLAAAATAFSAVTWMAMNDALEQGRELSQRIQGIQPWAYNAGELSTALSIYGVAKPEGRRVVPGLELVKAERVYGSDTAKFQILLYSDFECPACAAHHPELMSLVDTSGGNISLTFKHAPAHGQRSMDEAIAAECAALQDGNRGFFNMASLIFETTTGNGAGVDRPLGSLAKELKLDQREFLRCMDQQIPVSKVRADLEEAIGLEVQKTPSLLLVYKNKHALLQGRYTPDQIMSVFYELTGDKADQERLAPGANPT